MPYKRTYRRNRRKTKQSTRAIAKRSLALARKLDMSRERKYFDNFNQIGDISSAGSDIDGNPLFDLTQSIESDGYIGYECQAQRITVKGKIISQANQNDCHIRVICLWYKQANLANWDQVLATNMSTQWAVLAPYQPRTRNEFHVLYDKRFVQTQVTNPDIMFEFSRDLSKMGTTAFDDVSGNATRGAIYIFAVSDIGPGVNPKPDVQYFSRVTYTDA